MKKVISAALFAAMLLSVCGFTLGSGASDITTDHYILASFSDGEVTSDDLETLDMAGWYVDLSSNGTGVLSLGEEHDITYDGSVISDRSGNKFEYTLDGDTLAFDISSLLTGGSTFILYFTKTEAEGGAAPAAAADGVFASGTITTYRGDFYVEIVGAELFEDTNDKDAVRFYYDVTNLTNDTIYAGYVDTDAEQSGFELVTTYAYYTERVPEESNDYLDIEPGITIRCIEEFNCNLTAGGQVTFTLSDYGDYPVTATFDLDNLPGRPAEDLVLEPITDPTFFAGYPDAFDGTDFAISIDSAEVVEASRNSSVDNVLRVYYTYTNKRSEASYVGSSASIYVFQDGVELSTGYARYEVDEDDLYYEDLDAGATSAFAECFELRSDSPVEIVVEDWDGNIAAVVTPLP